MCHNRRCTIRLLIPSSGCDATGGALKVRKGLLTGLVLAVVLLLVMAATAQGLDMLGVKMMIVPLTMLCSAAGALAGFQLERYPLPVVLLSMMATSGLTTTLLLVNVLQTMDPIPMLTYGGGAAGIDAVLVLVTYLLAGSSAEGSENRPALWRALVTPGVLLVLVALSIPVRQAATAATSKELTGLVARMGTWDRFGWSRRWTWFGRRWASRRTSQGQASTYIGLTRTAT
jgi:hypothetical protein